MDTDSGFICNFDFELNFDFLITVGRLIDKKKYFHSKDRCFSLGLHGLLCYYFSIMPFA